MDEQCCKDVMPQGEWHSHKCRNKATVERDGKFYCSIHDPEKVKERREAQRKQWKEKEDAWEYKLLATGYCRDLGLTLEDLKGSKSERRKHDAFHADLNEKESEK